MELIKFNNHVMTCCFVKYINCAKDLSYFPTVLIPINYIFPKAIGSRIITIP
ncbi:MAG: hypothetical protein JW891_15195 [Candidatus Lokiarchaeota archaeon]|nr:hypothetical protein [Candidatus Lokiarchaeota archaeon]